MVRFLVARGWAVVREGRKHTVLAKEGVPLAVPRHRVLKVGTLRAILRQAGVARHEAVDEL